MYTLTKDQLSSLKSFVGKLDDTMIKGRIEQWVNNIKDDNRVTIDEMEKFVGFATHLPAEFQSFPMTFAQTVKNAPETAAKEEKDPDANKAELDKVISDSVKALKKEKPAKPEKEEVKEEQSKQKEEDKRIIASNKQVEEKGDKEPVTKKETVVIDKSKK